MVRIRGLKSVLLFAEELKEVAMKGLVSILNFDQVYQTQKFFHDIDYEWIELSDIKIQIDIVNHNL